MKRVLKRDEITEIISGARACSKKVVFTNGCFDILHLGHIRYLEKASELGDMLVVGINSDASVRKLKGEKRPIMGELERAEIISSLRCVDYVTIFDEDTPCELLSEIKPNIQVKGGDYVPETMPEYSIMQSLGGRIVCVAYDVTDTRDSSTTNIIERILEKN